MADSISLDAALQRDSDFKHNNKGGLNDDATHVLGTFVGPTGSSADTLEWRDTTRAHAIFA
ncbi:hypothetical protein NBRC116588_26860 [Pyruvatibacter sp. HU-CL02332]